MMNNLDCCHGTSVHMGSPPGMFASWIWSFQDGFHCRVVHINCHVMSIEVGMKVHHCPYHCLRFGIHDAVVGSALNSVQLALATGWRRPSFCFCDRMAPSHESLHPSPTQKTGPELSTSGQEQSSASASALLHLAGNLGSTQTWHPSKSAEEVVLPPQHTS